jgi:hypothetical protein
VTGCADVNELVVHSSLDATSSRQLNREAIFAAAAAMAIVNSIMKVPVAVKLHRPATSCTSSIIEHDDDRFYGTGNSAAGAVVNQFWCRQQVFWCNMQQTPLQQAKSSKSSLAHHSS